MYKERPNILHRLSANENRSTETEVGKLLLNKNLQRKKGMFARFFSIYFFFFEKANMAGKREEVKKK